jgi:hypothetical protein
VRNWLRAKSLLILMVFGASILNGCGIFYFERPNFKKVENFPKEKSLIYTYRLGDWPGIKYIIAVIDGKEIRFSRHPYYYPFLMDPGKYRINAGSGCEGCDLRQTCIGWGYVDIDLKPGKTYYVKLEAEYFPNYLKSHGTLRGINVFLVPPELAENEINKARLIHEMRLRKHTNHEGSICLRDCDVRFTKCLGGLEPPQGFCEEEKEVCLQELDRYNKRSAR